MYVKINNMLYLSVYTILTGKYIYISQIDKLIKVYP